MFTSLTTLTAPCFFEKMDHYRQQHYTSCFVLFTAPPLQLGGGLVNKTPTFYLRPFTCTNPRQNLKSSYDILKNNLNIWFMI